MTNLKSLIIDGCVFSGPIPSSIGNLMNLRSLVIQNVYSDLGIFFLHFCSNSLFSWQPQ
jgi:hypothetical protein